MEIQAVRKNNKKKLIMYEKAPYDRKKISAFTFQTTKHHARCIFLIKTLPSPLLTLSSRAQQLSGILPMPGSLVPGIKSCSHVN